MLKKISKYFMLGCVGGAVYYLIETIWKSSHTSHWTMLLLGAACFLILGGLNEFIDWDMPIWLQCLVGSTIITILEFITGCIVNLWLDWNVWHYERFDILGQICVPYSLLWILLSGVAIIADDWLRYWFFEEDKPHYTWRIK